MKPLSIALAVLFGALLLAALFAAYQHPALLVDFANVWFCG